MLIPAVSVITAITLLPAMLYMLGPRINSVRVMPRRVVEGSADPATRASGTAGPHRHPRPTLVCARRSRSSACS